MKELKIVNSNKVCLVDDEDYDRLSKFRWYLGVYDRVFRTYFKYALKFGNVSIANEVMQDYKSMFDHKNRNGLDEQKHNLRRCSYSQNNCNVSKRKKTSSSFLGVCFHKRDLVFEAYVSKNYVCHHAGYFDDEIEAAVARDKLAIKLHGEFASLNTLAIANRLTSGMLPTNCSINL